MSPILAVLGLSGGELLLVFAAVLVLFGAKKIPEFAKGLGKGIQEFKKASREVQDELERAADEANHPTPPRPTPTPASQTVAQTTPEPAVAPAATAATDVAAPAPAAKA